MRVRRTRTKAYSAATKKAFTTINPPIRSNPHTRCDALSTQTFPVRGSCCDPPDLLRRCRGREEGSHDPMTRKDRPRLCIERCCREPGIDFGVLNLGLSRP